MNEVSINLRVFDNQDSDACETILRSLPEWFGIEEAIIDYLRDIKNYKTFVAEKDNKIFGFITLVLHNKYTAEVQVMGVNKDVQRLGIGSALLKYSENFLKQNNYKFLEVKTLGPSSDDQYYQLTRGFYLKNKFYPLEENLHIWGKENPCLIMIKSL